MDLRRTSQFIWHFHFSPQKLYDEDPVVRRIAQYRVDKRLAIYAWRFLSEGNRQRRFQQLYGKSGHIRKGEFPGDPEGDEFEYNLTKRLIQRFKNRFWYAHKLARLAGYKVRRKVTDYLDYDLLIAWQINEAGGGDY